MLLHRYCELEIAETIVDTHETTMNKNTEDPSALLVPQKGLAATAATTDNNNNEVTVLEGFLSQLLSEVRVAEEISFCDQEEKQEQQHFNDDTVADQTAVLIVSDNAKLPSQGLHQCLLDRLCQSGVVAGDQDRQQRRQRGRFSDGCNIIYRPPCGSPTMTKESKRETRWSSTSVVNNSNNNNGQRDTQSPSSFGLVRPRRRCSEDFSIDDYNDDGTPLTSSPDSVRVVDSSFEQPSRTNLFRHKSDQEFLKKVQLEAGVDHRTHPLLSPTKLSKSSLSRFSSSSSSSSSSSRSTSSSRNSTSNDFSLPPVPVRGEMKIVHSSPERQYHKSASV